MLKPKVTTLPGHIQAIYVQNVLKLYARILLAAEEDDDQQTIREANALMMDRVPLFIQSADLEVQERVSNSPILLCVPVHVYEVGLYYRFVFIFQACCVLNLMKYIQKLQDKGTKCGPEVQALFAGDLNPVAPKAQKKVPVPEG